MPQEPVKPVGEFKEFNPSSGLVKPVGELQPFKSSQDRYQDLLRDNNNAYDQEEQFSKTRDIIDNIPDIKDYERDILFDMAKRGSKKEEISDAIATFQGTHPKQQTPNGTTIGANKYYYVNDEGKPVPVGPNEKPPAGHNLQSLWGSLEDAKDDNPFTTMGKVIVNGAISAAKGVINLADMSNQLVTGNEDPMFQGIRNAADIAKFRTWSEDAGEVFNGEGIKQAKDYLDPARYDFSYDKVANFVNQGVESLVSFALSGGPVKKLITGGGALALTAGKQIAASVAGASMMSMEEMMDVADEGGLKGQEKAAFVFTTAPVIGSLEAMFGGEGLLMRNSIARNEIKQIGKQALSTIARDERGMITKEGLDQVQKEMARQVAPVAKKWAKETVMNIGEESLTESLQEFVKESSKSLYDKMKDEPAFNSDGVGSFDAWSKYINSAIGAGLGSVGPSAYLTHKKLKIEREKEQSEHLFSVVQKGDKAISNFKANIKSLNDNGRISTEEANDALIRVDAFSEYNRIVGNYKNLDDSKKRELFDKTFQKQNLETQIAQELSDAGSTKDKLHPLIEGEYKAKRKMADDLQKDINDILTEAQVHEETVVAKKTIDDQAKKDIKEKDALKKTGPDGKKKPAISPALQALKDRFGFTTKPADQKLFEETNEKVYDDITLNAYNNPKFNARDKHRVTYDKLKTLPNEQMDAEVVEEHFEHKGKTNSTFAAQTADGRKLRFASSMKRAQWGRGWLEIGNKPKAVMTQDKAGYWHLDEKKLVGAPIAMKAVTIKDAEGKDKGAIKVFYAGKGEDYGKFIGWARATNSGRTKVSEAEQVQYEEEEKRQETPPTPTQQAPGAPIAPVGPTTPFTPQVTPAAPQKALTPVQQRKREGLEHRRQKSLASITAGMQPNSYAFKVYEPGPNMTVIESEETNTTREKMEAEVHKIYDSELEAMNQSELEQKALDTKPKEAEPVKEVKNEEPTITQESTPDGEKPEPGDNNQNSGESEKSRQRREARESLRKKIAVVNRKIKSYNAIPFREKSEEAGTALYNQIQSDAKEIEHDITIRDKRKLSLTKNGKRVIGEKAASRSKEAIAEEEYKNEFRKRALNAEPQSVRHAVIMDLANGLRFNLQDLIRRGKLRAKLSEDGKTYLKPKEIPALMVQNKGGISFEFYAQRMNELQGIRDGEPVDTEAIANEAAAVVMEFAHDKYREEATKEAEEILERSENQGMTKAEIEALIAAKRAEAERNGLEDMPEEGNERIDWLEYYDQEEIEALAEEQDLYDEWDSVIKSGDKQQFIDFHKKLLKHIADYDPALDKLYDKQLGELYERQKEAGLVLQKKSQFSNERIDKVVAIIKKAFPKVNVVYDPKLKAAGQLKGNNLIINPYFAGKDTPIHEAAHILIDAIGYDNKVIQAAIKQLQGTDLWKEIADRYPELDEKGLAIEVLAEAIGREGAGIFETEQQKSNFRQWIEYIFDWAKRKLGLDRNIAKSLAKKIIGGKFTQELEGKNEVAQDQKTDKAFDKFRSDVIGRDLDEEQQTIDFIEDQLDNNEDLSDEDVEVLESARQSLMDQYDEDKEAYEDYKKNKAKANKILEENNAGDYKLEELIDLYNNLSEEEESTREAKMMIADHIYQNQIKVLSKVDKDIEDKVNRDDMSWIESWFKNLNDVSHKHPLLQGLNKLFDSKYLDKVRESNNRKKKLRDLGKKVIRERNGILGIVGDLMTSNNAKYFNFIEDNGKLRTDTSGLTQAQKDFLQFYTGLVQERQGLMTNGEVLDNGLIVTDREVRETYKQDGFLAAASVYLGGNSNINAEIEWKGLDGKTKRSTYLEAQKEILDYGSAPSATIKNKAKALGKLMQIGYKAAKHERHINYSGALRSKYSEENPKAYSKDFYKAAMEFIDESAHMKHLKDLVPVVEAIEQFYHQTGVKQNHQYANTERFIKEWKTSKLYHGKVGSDPILDNSISFIRHITSVITMAFNTTANLLNIAIGNYNTMRDDSLYKWGVGQVRLFKNLPKMMKIVNHYDVVGIDYDSNPKAHVGKLFDMLAHAGMKWGEVQIQASQFLGKMTDDEIKAFSVDKDGKVTVTPPAGMTKEQFEDKMIQYKNEVSDVQGKYNEKDRRNFMNIEAGKAAAQFKVWIPDWWKLRFGKEFIDSRGNIRRGTWNMFTDRAIQELKDDFQNGDSPVWKTVLTRPDKAVKGLLTGDSKAAKAQLSNLKGALMIAGLLIATHGDDDDDKRRKKLISMQNTMNQILFVFDLDQLDWTISQPFAIQGTIHKFIDVLKDILDHDGKELQKDAKKIIPYNKITDVPDTFTK
jgi:hypothetical protein